jgi:hypothetical protein
VERVELGDNGSEGGNVDLVGAESFGEDGSEAGRLLDLGDLGDTDARLGTRMNQGSWDRASAEAGTDGVAEFARSPSRMQANMGYPSSRRPEPNGVARGLGDFCQKSYQLARLFARLLCCAKG